MKPVMAAAFAGPAPLMSATPQTMAASNRQTAACRVFAPGFRAGLWNSVAAGETFWIPKRGINANAQQIAKPAAAVCRRMPGEGIGLTAIGRLPDAR